MALRPKLSNNRKRKIRMLLGRAFEALQSGEHEQCERLCKEIDGIQPGNADAAYLRGVLARDCDQCEQAESHFCKAIEAAPKRVDFVAALAGLYLSVGEYK
ncbi:MAG: sulfotransferase family protein, partial [Mariprofundus sp.]|nr:sulfotransferase family protein [Mariprofundus sp.]